MATKVCSIVILVAIFCLESAAKPSDSALRENNSAATSSSRNDSVDVVTDIDSEEMLASADVSQLPEKAPEVSSEGRQASPDVPQGAEQTPLASSEGRQASDNASQSAEQTPLAISEGRQASYNASQGLREAEAADPSDDIKAEKPPADGVLETHSSAGLADKETGKRDPETRDQRETQRDGRQLDEQGGVKKSAQHSAEAVASQSPQQEQKQTTAAEAPSLVRKHFLLEIVKRVRFGRIRTGSTQGSLVLVGSGEERLSHLRETVVEIIRTQLASLISEPKLRENLLGKLDGRAIAFGKSKRRKLKNENLTLADASLKYRRLTLIIVGRGLRYDTLGFLAGALIDLHYQTVSYAEVALSVPGGGKLILRDAPIARSVVAWFGTLDKVLGGEDVLRRTKNKTKDFLEFQVLNKKGRRTAVLSLSDKRGMLFAKGFKETPKGIIWSSTSVALNWATGNYPAGLLNLGGLTLFVDRETAVVRNLWVTVLERYADFENRRQFRMVDVPLTWSAEEIKKFVLRHARISSDLSPLFQFCSADRQQTGECQPVAARRFYAKALFDIAASGGVNLSIVPGAPISPAVTQQITDTFFPRFIPTYEEYVPPTEAIWVDIQMGRDGRNSIEVVNVPTDVLFTLEALVNEVLNRTAHVPALRKQDGGFKWKGVSSAEMHHFYDLKDPSTGEPLGDSQKVRGLPAALVLQDLAKRSSSNEPLRVVLDLTDAGKKVQRKNQLQRVFDLSFPAVIDLASASDDVVMLALHVGHWMQDGNRVTGSTHVLKVPGSMLVAEVASRIRQQFSKAAFGSSSTIEFPELMINVEDEDGSHVVEKSSAKILKRDFTGSVTLRQKRQSDNGATVALSLAGAVLDISAEETSYSQLSFVLPDSKIFSLYSVPLDSTRSEVAWNVLRHLPVYLSQELLSSFEFCHSSDAGCVALFGETTRRDFVAEIGRLRHVAHLHVRRKRSAPIHEAATLSDLPNGAGAVFERHAPPPSRDELLTVDLHLVAPGRRVIKVRNVRRGLMTWQFINDIVEHIAHVPGMPRKELQRFFYLKAVSDYEAVHERCEDPNFGGCELLNFVARCAENEATAAILLAKRDFGQGNAPVAIPPLHSKTVQQYLMNLDLLELPDEIDFNNLHKQVNIGVAGFEANGPVQVRGVSSEMKIYEFVDYVVKLSSSKTGFNPSGGVVLASAWPGDVVRDHVEIDGSLTIDKALMVHPHSLPKLMYASQPELNIFKFYTMSVEISDKTFYVRVRAHPHARFSQFLVGFAAEARAICLAQTVSLESCDQIDPSKLQCYERENGNVAPRKLLKPSSSASVSSVLSKDNVVLKLSPDAESEHFPPGVLAGLENQAINLSHIAPSEEEMAEMLSSQEAPPARFIPDWTPQKTDDLLVDVGRVGQVWLDQMGDRFMAAIPFTAIDVQKDTIIARKLVLQLRNPVASGGEMILRDVPVESSTVEVMPQILESAGMALTYTASRAYRFCVGKAHNDCSLLHGEHSGVVATILSRNRVDDALAFLAPSQKAYPPFPKNVFEALRGEVRHFTAVDVYHSPSEKQSLRVYLDERGISSVIVKNIPPGMLIHDLLRRIVAGHLNFVVPFMAFRTDGAFEPLVRQCANPDIYGCTAEELLRAARNGHVYLLQKSEATWTPDSQARNSFIHDIYPELLERAGGVIDLDGPFSVYFNVQGYSKSPAGISKIYGIEPGETLQDVLETLKSIVRHRTNYDFLDSIVMGITVDDKPYRVDSRRRVLDAALDLFGGPPTIALSEKSGNPVGMTALHDMTFDAKLRLMKAHQVCFFVGSEVSNKKEETCLQSVPADETRDYLIAFLLKELKFEVTHGALGEFHFCSEFQGHCKPLEPETAISLPLSILQSRDQARPVRFARKAAALFDDNCTEPLAGRRFDYLRPSPPKKITLTRQVDIYNGETGKLVTRAGDVPLSLLGRMFVAEILSSVARQEEVPWYKFFRLTSTPKGTTAVKGGICAENPLTKGCDLTELLAQSHKVYLHAVPRQLWPSASIETRFAVGKAIEDLKWLPKERSFKDSWSHLHLQIEGAGALFHVFNVDSRTTVGELLSNLATSLIQTLNDSEQSQKPVWALKRADGTVIDPLSRVTEVPFSAQIGLAAVDDSNSSRMLQMLGDAAYYAVSSDITPTFVADGISMWVLTDEKQGKFAGFQVRGIPFSTTEEALKALLLHRAGMSTDAVRHFEFNQYFQSERSVKALRTAGSGLIAEMQRLQLDKVPLRLERKPEAAAYGDSLASLASKSITYEEIRLRTFEAGFLEPFPIVIAVGNRERSLDIMNVPRDMTQEELIRVLARQRSQQVGFDYKEMWRLMEICVDELSGSCNAMAAGSSTQRIVEKMAEKPGNRLKARVRTSRLPTDLLCRSIAEELTRRPLSWQPRGVDVQERVVQVKVRVDRGWSVFNNVPEDIPMSKLLDKISEVTVGRYQGVRLFDLPKGLTVDALTYVNDRQILDHAADCAVFFDFMDGSITAGTYVSNFTTDPWIITLMHRPTNTCETFKDRLLGLSRIELDFKSGVMYRTTGEEVSSQQPQDLYSEALERFEKQMKTGVEASSDTMNN